MAEVAARCLPVAPKAFHTHKLSFIGAAQPRQRLLALNPAGISSAERQRPLDLGQADLFAALLAEQKRFALADALDYGGALLAVAFRAEHRREACDIHVAL